MKDLKAEFEQIYSLSIRRGEDSATVLKNRSTKVDDGNTAQTDANTVLAAVPTRKAKCYNCKHASSAFKIAGKTHHQCNHPKHKEGFENGTLSPWDTLQEFYNSCNTHEFR